MDDRIPPFPLCYKDKQKKIPRKQSLAYKNPICLSYIVGIDNTPKELS